MKKQVAVMSLDAEDGEIIMVVASVSPPECYANKDCEHAGRVIAGCFVPAKGDKDRPAAQLTEGEQIMVVRASFALRVALDAIHGVHTT